MRIGVDIDGVLYHWSRTARWMLREVLPNSPYTKDGPLGLESQSWDYIHDNVSREHWKWLWKEGIQLGLFRHGNVVAGALQGMRKLAEDGHELIILTHRPRSAVNDTLAWLSYQQLQLAGVHILTEQEPKSSVRHCEIYIDDKPDNAIDLYDNTHAKMVCLLRQPWNMDWIDQDGRAIISVNGWPNFLSAVSAVNGVSK